MNRNVAHTLSPNCIERSTTTRWTPAITYPNVRRSCWTDWLLDKKMLFRSSHNYVQHFYLSNIDPRMSITYLPRPRPKPLSTIDELVLRRYWVPIANSFPSIYNKKSCSGKSQPASNFGCYGETGYYLLYCCDMRWAPFTESEEKQSEKMAYPTWYVREGI